MKKRCSWPGSDEQMIKYHDKEWGLPIHNDKKIFEFLILDTFQAGLSWQIILRKRKNFKKAFDNYNIKKISKYGKRDFNRLMKDAGIVRNRLKIQAAIINSEKFLGIKKEFGTFSRYIWGFTKGVPIINKFKKMGEIPAKTVVSDTISKDMKERGFRFVGSTTIYAFMQGMGIVNDHATYCFRHKEVQK